ncbi:MAG TPA: GMC family oxidoreductase [Polyangiaceae bacterium]|nr:GMC family oxidoreductase [Polyangiaceae bacterium]
MAESSGLGPTAVEVLRGREIRAPLSLRADVVIVGSGAGGAVVAREMARAGRSVVVVEEGPFVAPGEYGKLPPMGMFRRCAREAGLSAVVGLGGSPFISLLMGRCVGGSSVLTGGVCFRIPDEVLHEWSGRLGLTSMTPEGLDPHFRVVERVAHVETVPDAMRSRGIDLFTDGAAKLGIPMKPLRRNTRGCRGASRCNFGCPHGAKMSVDVSFLPEATARGALVVSDALVERVDVTSGVARGVRGRLITDDGARVPFEVRARVVVVACGSLHTPLLLRASGVDSRHVGRHLTLHPAVRVSALFDEVVEGWDGAMQPVFSDHFASEGVTLVGVYPPVSVLAAGFPGVGRKHRALAHRTPNMAVFGGMIHDEGGGSVHRVIGREPLVTYRMAREDRPRLVRLIEILGRMAFAAGAREVAMPVFGIETMKSVKEVDDFAARPPPMRRIECTAFHPLGSAKMSTDPREGVVRESGETWQVDNLFVADGSVLPTSIGVNSQLPIMAVAHKIASGIAADWDRLARRAA